MIGSGPHIAYAIAKVHGRVIGGTVVGRTRDAADREFEVVFALRPDRVRRFMKFKLSAAWGEHLSDEQWRRIADRVIRALGYGRCPYIVIRHCDTGIDHVHLEVTSVTIDGLLVDRGHDYYRAQVIAREIELTDGLTVVHSSWETTDKQLSWPDIQRVRDGQLPFGVAIRPTVEAAVGRARTWDNLIDDLGQAGIHPARKHSGLFVMQGEARAALSDVVPGQSMETFNALLGESYDDAIQRRLRQTAPPEVHPGFDRGTAGQRHEESGVSGLHVVGAPDRSTAGRDKDTASRRNTTRPDLQAGGDYAQSDRPADDGPHAPAGRATRGAAPGHDPDGGSRTADGERSSPAHLGDDGRDRDRPTPDDLDRLDPPAPRLESTGGAAGDLGLLSAALRHAGARRTGRRGPVAPAPGPEQQAAELRVLRTLLEMVSQRQKLQQTASDARRELRSARERLAAARRAPEDRDLASWRLDSALTIGAEAPLTVRAEIDLALKTGDHEIALSVARQYGPVAEGSCTDLYRAVERLVPPSIMVEWEQQLAVQEDHGRTLQQVLAETPSLDDLQSRIARLLGRLPDAMLAVLSAEERTVLRNLQPAQQRAAGLEI